MLKKFDVNTVGKDYVVGDIHGCFTMLERDLEDIGFNPEIDRLFSVGDLVDRGDESHRSIEFLEKPWFHAVIGNHEDMAIKIFNNEWGVENYIRNGGLWFVALPEEEQLKFCSAFRALPLAIQVGNIGIIHADPPTNWDRLHTNQLSQHDIQEAIWGRTRINLPDNYCVINGISKVFVGHTILEEVRTKGNITYIDTGAYSKNNLTILELV